MQLQKCARTTTDEQKAATRASADSWRAACERYRAAEAAQGPPEVPSERTMLARVEAHFDSALGDSHYHPRACAKGSGERVMHRKAGY